MVGLLKAPVGTKLFQRLKNENRIISDFSGDNTDLSINFTPKMNIQKLTNGYKKIVTTIYDPKPYYDRVMEFFKEFKPVTKKNISMLRFCYVKGFLEQCSFWDFRKRTASILEISYENVGQISRFFRKRSPSLSMAFTLERFSVSTTGKRQMNFVIIPFLALDCFLIK